jgi:hypothetical protein
LQHYGTNNPWGWISTDQVLNLFFREVICLSFTNLWVIKGLYGR